MKEYSAQEIFALVEGEKSLTGSENGILISNIKPLAEADQNSLVWLSPKKKEMIAHIATTPARLIIVATDFDSAAYPDKCFIKVTDPRLAFIRVATSMSAAAIKWGKHPTAAIHPDAKIHPNTFIGAFTYIGDCEIGEGTVIFGHCYLYDGVRVGKNVRIHAGTVIGTDGFGYQRNADGEFEKFPHVGGVIIEDDVEIGSNTVIDRGTLGDTVIRQAAKVDNLVHVAHNVDIGKHTCVIANSMLGGSNKIGEYCWIAPSSSTLENLKVGSHSRVGLGSVVMRDVPENANMIGNPAINLRILPKKE